MPFIPNRRFRREYDRLFQANPLRANIFLLLSELADDRGEVVLPNPPERALRLLLTARFDDPRGYQLPGGPKR